MFQRSKPITKYDSILLILSAFMFCAWGGIYDFTAALYGVIFAVGILILFHRKKKIMIPQNMASIAMLLLCIAFLLSWFSAKDKGMAFVGLLRVLVLAGFWILWCNLSDDRREQIWRFLPHMISVITLVSMLIYAVPSMREYLFRADRLGGVFQYSNTYALILLIAMILILNEKAASKYFFAEIAILTVGILLCGSRSTVVLMAAAWISLTVWKKINWKMLLYMLVIAGITILLASLFSSFDIQRLQKLTLESSTLNGRFLYWYDALPILGSHPLGLGYMGYYFLQPQFQTGNYVTKYVHNDFLQFGLDGGWLALTALVFLIIFGICHKRQSGINRFIIILISVHALFDFDLQYIWMFLLLLMCINVNAKKEWGISGRTLNIVAFAGSILFGYFALSLGMAHAGADRVAIKLYPQNTFAREKLITDQEDVESAQYLIEKNGMIATAYECLALDEIQQGKYDAAYEHIDSMLQCAGYDSYYYNQAVYYWSICLDYAYRSEDLDAAADILERIKQMPSVIEQKESSASMLARRINDKPEIVLEEAVIEYLRKMETVSL